MPFDGYACVVQLHIVLDMVPDPSGKGDVWDSNPATKACNCKLLLPPGEYKCDSALYQITLVIVVAIINTYAAVESMPEDGWNVEEDGLAEEYERYPLVVGDHLPVVVVAW